MDVEAYMAEIGRNARRASRATAVASTAQKSVALRGIAAALERDRAQLGDANRRDVEAARRAQLDQPLIDRLLLDGNAIDRMIGACSTWTACRIRSVRSPISLTGRAAFRSGGCAFRSA